MKTTLSPCHSLVQGSSLAPFRSSRLELRLSLKTIVTSLTVSAYFLFHCPDFFFPLVMEVFAHHLQFNFHTFLRIVPATWQTHYPPDCLDQPYYY